MAGQLCGTDKLILMPVRDLRGVSGYAVHCRCLTNAVVGIDSSIVGAVQLDERGHLLSTSCVLSINCLIGTSPQSVEGGFLQPLLQPRG